MVAQWNRCLLYTSTKNLILYEPDGETVFDAIVPEYLAGLVYGGICESTASELAARRMAMDAATSNAEEMIDQLNLYYNRARQASITQEIKMCIRDRYRAVFPVFRRN